MIYIRPDPTDPIRQGDIFRGVPRMEASFDRLPVLNDDDSVIEVAWQELLVAHPQDAVTALVSVRPVDAIVITQDCDAVRSPYIAMCEIRVFPEVEGRAKDAKMPRSWMRIITQHARINLKWFYLPADATIGFDAKMGADFRRVLGVASEQLEGMTDQHRIGRLNEPAAAHFRERLAEFYRRYPYDEWYPLTKDELAAYRKSKPEPIEPYPWQE